MKTILQFGLCAALLSGLALPAHAQLGIQLKTNQVRYVRYEPIQVTVTLFNYTGNSLFFGGRDSEGRLRLLVESNEGFHVPAFDEDVNPAADLSLGAGESKSLTLAINTMYNMQREGQYTVRAQIEHPRLDKNYRSEACIVAVAAGSEIWSREVGVPDDQATTPIHVKKVSLRLFPDRNHDLYVLQVEDDNVVYGVVRLGSRITGTQPLCDVDAISNIHVLFMTRPRFFEYRVYDSSLQLKQSQFYAVDATTNASPSLQRDPEVGRVLVTGGRLALKGVDYEDDAPKAATPATAPGARTPEAGGTAAAAPGKTTAPDKSPEADKVKKAGTPVAVPVPDTAVPKPAPGK